jgi:hypothetical protein
MKHSILTEYDGYCAMCGKPKDAIHHLLFGSMRKLADEDMVFIPLCNECHNMAQNKLYQIHDNPAAEKLSKMLGQVAWEKEYLAKELEKCGYDIDDIKDEARTHFMARYGQSFL